MYRIVGDWSFSWRGPSHRAKCFAMAHGDADRAFSLFVIASEYLLPMYRAYKVENIRSEHGYWRSTGIRLEIGLVRFLEGLPNNGGYSMAKKQSVAVRAWVNVTLSDTDKDAILSMDFDVESIMLAIASMVYSGYRFSVTFDEYSSALQVSLVCGNQDDPNYGLGMSSRHPDFDVALRSLWYKHQVMTRGSWADYAAPPQANSWS
jgi:hypothetical protein